MGILIPYVVKCLINLFVLLMDHFGILIILLLTDNEIGFIDIVLGKCIVTIYSNTNCEVWILWFLGSFL